MNDLLAYMFVNSMWDEINKTTLFDAIRNTSRRRNTTDSTTRSEDYIKLIEEDDVLERLWVSYQERYEYAKDISFSDTIKAIKIICEVITPITV